jgi:hypothetical protein
MRDDTFENHAGSADNARARSLAGKARPILTFSRVAGTLLVQSIQPILLRS